MEVEKKYLIKTLPEALTRYQKYEIEQAYISHKPTIRVRKKDDEYILTIKSKRGIKEANGVLVNQETEILLLEEEYLELLKNTKGNIVKKTRYLVPLEDGKMAELDIFKGKLSGLVFAEVEFQSVEEAISFLPPSWFGRDISEDGRYRNTELSKIEIFIKEEYMN